MPTERHGEEVPPLVGWCAEHDGMAMLYDDGSIACHYLAVVEMHSDDCRMAPLPLERLYGYSPTQTGREGRATT